MPVRVGHSLPKRKEKRKEGEGVRTGRKENLKIIRSTEEARERGKKGGIASGKVRRRKKDVRTALIALLSCEVQNKKQRKMMADAGIEEKDMTFNNLVSLSIINAVVRGNSQMAQLLLKTIGELEPDKMELTGKDGKPLAAAPAVQIYLPDNQRGGS